MLNKILTEHRCGALVAGVLALTLLAGCSPESDAAAPQAAPSNAAPSAAAPNAFGPEGFGKLTLTMTEQEALATGELGPSPVAVVTGCRDYSFKDGPAPDPGRMAADAKLEKRYQAAQKAADKANRKADKKLRPNASAQEYADSAQDSADAAAASSKALELNAASMRRAADRTAAFTQAGGASFGGGKLRVLVAPPPARTAAGIARGSTVEQLQSAYQGLKETSAGRFEVPVADRPGWSFTFDVEKGKVAYFLLLNAAITCV